MRKQLLMLLGIAMLSISSYAQTREVSGQVKDDKGQPIPYATVKIKGSTKAASADQNGNFHIQVTGAKPTLQISAAGFDPSDVAVSQSGAVGIVLKPQASMSEVVVTALGIKRNRNTLPYAAQQIKGDDVSNIRTGNAASALSGKISGLEIRQGNSIGGSTNVVIRGTKSLFKNNQALFVVDGVPVDNTNTNRSNKDLATNGNQSTGRGGYDYGNAAADINPDDIESINVLKGAAASALYGSRAANGVIMITTKQGRKGAPNITVNAGLTVGSIDKTTYPKYQNQYGAGYSDSYQKNGFFYFDANGDGVKDLVVPTSEDASYGAKFDPSLMVYYWDSFDPASPNYMKTKPWVAAQNGPATFYETAVSNNASIFLDGGNDRGSYKLGYTRNEEKGTLPNSKIVKNIVNFGSSYNIAKGLTANATINVSKVDGKGRYGTGYSGLNVNQNFRQWYQTNVDIQEQKSAYFRQNKNITWNWADPSKPADSLAPAFTDNYYWTRYQNYQNDTRTRAFGNVALTYKVNSWLNFLGRYALDHYDELQEERIAVGSKDVSKYSRYNHTFNESNMDLLANVDKDLNKDFNLKVLAGLNVRKLKENSIYATTSGGLVVPNLYAVANSKGTVAAPTEIDKQIVSNSYFGGATLSYRDMLTLDGSIRRDISSTLPPEHNKYNYYAVSGSWVFSKMLPTLSWLSYGKLRLNYAEVGNDAEWNTLYDAYTIVAPFGPSLMYSLPTTKNNSSLKPEKTISKEVGLEASFLNSRLGFDVTYYLTDSKDQTMPVAVSSSTGYSNKWVNAGTIRNKGVELGVNITPIKTQSFSWDMRINWSKNKSLVVALFDTSKNLQLATFQGGVSLNATLGEPYGTIQGKTTVKTADGKEIVADQGSGAGYYKVTTTTTNVIGNMNPDWIGGIYNTFRYKNISLGFLVDIRQGGDVFSLDQYYAAMTGVYVETAALNDLGKPRRNSLADGGGVILPGVTPDGKANTQRVVIDANSPAIPPSHFVYDASYVKLREAVLTYTFPQSVLKNVKFIKGADFSIIGRNLWIIHKNLPYADPEENLTSGNTQGYQSGAYPTTRTIGANLKLRF